MPTRRAVLLLILCAAVSAALGFAAGNYRAKSRRAAETSGSAPSVVRGELEGSDRPQSLWVLRQEGGADVMLMAEAEVPAAGAADVEGAFAGSLDVAGRRVRVFTHCVRAK